VRTGPVALAPDAPAQHARCMRLVRILVGLRISAGLVVLAPVAGAACGTEECTAFECSDRAIVSYPADLVDGAYDLVIESDLGSVQSRCLAAAPPEGPENSPGLSCDKEGFQLDDTVVASAREIRVTITDVDTGDVLAAGERVDLDVVAEDEPNGPGCSPVCYERNGQLLVDGVPG
ncbi:MAG TPA: hypothetical protein VFG69_17415, partial [Nannocystaceae bacterium]|nr:hypothetical protein [Nannocystaceae bacterium]